MSRPRILVVDDDADLTEALKLWFEKRDCDVTFASNGTEGMLVLRAGEPIDLVLTDFMMPELNGIELVRLVKSSLELFATKIVVMSSNTNPEFRKKAWELGAIEFLSKADSARVIVEKVLAILGRPAVGPETATPPDDISVMTESLVNLMEVIGLVEGVPPAAKTAVAAARKLAARIHEWAAHPALKVAKEPAASGAHSRPA